MTHFDFVDLRLFIHIAEENSLTRGAERVHMSLPAASTRIKNLEEVLGFLAVILATLNVVGGFVVTDRMLEMFKPRRPQTPNKPDDTK